MQLGRGILCGDLGTETKLQLFLNKKILFQFFSASHGLFHTPCFPQGFVPGKINAQKRCHFETLEFEMAIFIICYLQKKLCIVRDTMKQVLRFCFSTNHHHKK